MPIADRYDISEVLDACIYYFRQTGRRITFEYSLVGGVNDTDEDAEHLCSLVGGLNCPGFCHVNLIPVNWGWTPTPRCKPAWLQTTQMGLVR